MVEDVIKPAVLDVIHGNQYGAIPKSSTTMALISMLHVWFLGMDGNGATVRTMLFDYHKACDFIDHSILIDKLCKLDIPRSVVNWIIDFLSDRFQCIKLAKGCFSKWGSVPSGVPQGTKLGLWLFVLMINDLDIKSPLMWIFVDDTTASEVIQKGNTSNTQGITDELIKWSRMNRVVLNPDKCKELRILFSRNPEAFDLVSIDDKEIEVVNSAKLLGITISDKLTWNTHINELVKKTNKKTILSCTAETSPTTSFRPSSFPSFVCSIYDYGVPVFHNALPQYLKNEHIHNEKRALSIILPSMSYNKACEVLGITPITEHHSQLCTKLFDAIVADPNHKLHGLLPQKNNVVYNFRYNRPFVLPRVHTNRANNTFILAMSRLFNASSHNT